MDELSIKNIILGNPNWDEKEDTITGDETRLPPLYKVILYNDDYTTMEFVIYILQTVFHKSLPEAQKVMLDVHEKGSGVCGVYAFDIAETKVEKVLKLARENSHPLKCELEEE